MAVREKSRQNHVVVLGGGNGTSQLLRALLPLLEKGEISSLHALVHMADDGGSTGRLREQYDVGSMGDLTKCLMALSTLHDDMRGEELLRALEYRFAKGDFKGHTLRNILLAVFQLSSGDIDSAIAILARLLQIPKEAGVIPITLHSLTQQVEIERDGRRRILGEGEHFIAHNVDLQADPAWRPGDVQVTFSDGNLALNPRAQEVLEGASHIVVAPGHTYGTILPALGLPALKGAVGGSSAQLIVVMTLLTTPKQTTNWQGEDFVRVYESYLGRKVDLVIANKGQADVELVEGQTWVEFKDKKHPYQLIAKNMVSLEPQVQDQGDVVPRAIVIHDAAKIREIFREIFK